MSDVMLSPDGNYYWDGQAWQSAISPDGHWRWDGEEWQPAEPAPAVEPVSYVPAATPESTSAPRAEPVSGPPGPWQVVAGQGRTLTHAQEPPAVGLAGMLPSDGPPPARSTRAVGSRMVPTTWTAPLVWIATAYFVGSGVYVLLFAAALALPLRLRLEDQFRQTGMPIDSARSLAGTLAGTITTLAVLFAVLAVLLGLVSFRRMKVVYYVDMLYGFVNMFVGGYAATTPAGDWDSLPRSLAFSFLLVEALGGMLFLAMLFARRAHGPWGLHRELVYEERGA